MTAFLLVLLVLDALLLILVVLLQPGRGEGLAAMGTTGAGMETIFGSRQATTILTKATWWTGGIFLALVFFLAVLAGRSGRPSSILRERAPASAPAAPVPGSPAPSPLTPSAPRR